jgi:hypothetical protein
VSTAQLVQSFEQQGYTVHSGSVGRAKAENIGFQRHMLRLRRADLTFKNVGDSIPEIIIVNSHDGKSSAKVMLGVFRLVCSNGMIVGNTFAGITVKHLGNVKEHLNNAVEEIQERLPIVASTIERLQNTELTPEQALSLAYKGSAIVVPAHGTNISVLDALRVRRQGDAGMDAWKVFNRVQEACLRGGIRYKTLDDNGAVRNNTTKAIVSVKRQVEVNQALFDLVAA